MIAAAWFGSGFFLGMLAVLVLLFVLGAGARMMERAPYPETE